MFVKTKQSAVKKPAKKPLLKTKSVFTKLTKKPTENTITEALKVKILPYIVNDFADALKSLQAGESIRFGKLGTFKKSRRTVNGYTGYQYSFKAHSLVKK
jgi:hypothetical protein